MNEWDTTSKGEPFARATHERGDTQYRRRLNEAVVYRHRRRHPLTSTLQMTGHK